MSDPWLAALRDECAKTSQARVARRIGYTPSVVSQVLKGAYKGDLKAVKKAVEGGLLSATLDCPALGFVIRADRCLDFQRRPLDRATAPHHARLWRTCPTCPNSRGMNREGEPHAE
jgi:transcriptional regulator with XRE-family HTH domain